LKYLIIGGSPEALFLAGYLKKRRCDVALLTDQSVREALRQKGLSLFNGCTQAQEHLWLPALRGPEREGYDFVITQDPSTLEPWVEDLQSCRQKPQYLFFGGVLPVKSELMAAFHIQLPLYWDQESLHYWIPDKDKPDPLILTYQKGRHSVFREVISRWHSLGFTGRETSSLDTYLWNLHWNRIFVYLILKGVRQGAEIDASSADRIFEAAREGEGWIKKYGSSLPGSLRFSRRNSFGLGVSRLQTEYQNPEYFTFYRRYLETRLPESLQWLLAWYAGSEGSLGETPLLKRLFQEAQRNFTT